MMYGAGVLTDVLCFSWSLPSAIHFVGVMISVGGLLVATPGAVSWAWRGGALWLRNVVGWRPAHRHKTSSVSSDISILSEVRGRVRSVSPKGSTQRAMIHALMERTEQIDQELNEIWVRIGEVTGDLRATIEDRYSTLSGEIAAVRLELERERRQQRAIDGRGLIITAVGIAVTEGSGLAVHLSRWIAAIILACIVWLCFIIASAGDGPD